MTEVQSGYGVLKIGKKHGTTPLPLWTSIITFGKKNDDEKTLLLKIIWL